MKGGSGFSSVDLAVVSNWSLMSSGHGDCRLSSERMALEYSPHGLKSRPKECSSSIRLVSAVRPLDVGKALNAAQIQIVTNHVFQHPHVTDRCANSRSHRTLRAKHRILQIIGTPRV